MGNPRHFRVICIRTVNTVVKCSDFTVDKCCCFKHQTRPRQRAALT